MKKTKKIKKNYEFNKILKKGKYFCGNNIECFYLKNNKNINLLGIAISSKICNAVKRNKIKRLIREVYTKEEEKISSGNTFIFLWKKKSSIENCSFYSVYEDIQEIFKKIGIYISEENSNNIN